MTQPAERRPRDVPERQTGRLGSVGSWALVAASCLLLVIYLILHAREIGLILTWLTRS